jgi:subtilisin family serine protease
MKNHIKIKLKKAISPGFVYWQDILVDKSSATSHLHPTIDPILAEFHLPVWVTQEYRSANKQWDTAELATGLDRVYRLILQQDQEIPVQLIQRLLALPMVEEARIGEIAQVDLPKLLPQQMSRTTDERSRRAIYLDEAHRYTQGDPRITVAVLDTGITLSHPELQDVLLPGYDFVDILNGAGKFIGDYLGYDDVPDDEVGHGTHVAGIIAAKGIDMPLGVVPKCKILPVRVLGAMERSGGKPVGAGLVDNINAGIKWAIDNGADVINMSLGIQHSGGGLPHQEVVDYARHKGVTIVAASGNDGTEQLYYPSALPYVLAVGAADEEGRTANFSTFGKVDLMAPGTNIYSTYLDNTYAPSTGTSHASPFVAGAVASLKSYALQKWNTRLHDNQVKSVLRHSADKIDPYFKHPKAGCGMLNLFDALQLLDYKLSS